MSIRPISKAKKLEWIDQEIEITIKTGFFSAMKGVFAWAMTYIFWKNGITGLAVFSTVLLALFAFQAASCIILTIILKIRYNKVSKGAVLS